jgi:hypothetical protein
MPGFDILKSLFSAKNLFGNISGPANPFSAKTPPNPVSGQNPLESSPTRPTPPRPAPLQGNVSRETSMNPSNFKEEFDKHSQLYNQQLNDFENYKSLESRESAGTKSIEWLKGNFSKTIPEFPEAHKKIEEYYTEDTEFAKGIDRFYQNMLAMQHNLPSSVEAGDQAKEASGSLIERIKSFLGVSNGSQPVS